MYTDSGLIETYLKRELTLNEQATLSVLLPAIKNYIDNKLSTTFEKDPPVETRYFDGGEYSIDIDPCYDIEEIKSVNNDNSSSYIYTDRTEYTAEPANSSVKNELVRREGYWPRGDQRVAVTARFSSWDNGVPQDIKMASTKIAADMLSMGSNDASNIESESLEGHSVKYRNPNETVDKLAQDDPFVQSILQQRRQLLVG